MITDTSFEVEVKEVLEEVGRSLIERTSAYGDSALRPLRVFSRAGAEEGLRVRRKGDYYPTPSWCVRALIETVDLPSGRWLEPTAGDGAIIRAANAVLRGGVAWEAIEINEEHRGSLEATGATVQIADVMAADLSGDYRMVIGNPPYSYAEEIIDRVLSAVECPVAMLLPLTFLAGQRRDEFYRRHGIPDVLVLPRRPSFVGCGTAAVDYGWMIWQSEAGRGLLPGRIDRIALEACHD